MRGNSITIVERRPPWLPELGPDWSNTAPPSSAMTRTTARGRSTAATGTSVGSSTSTPSRAGRVAAPRRDRGRPDRHLLGLTEPSARPDPQAEERAEGRRRPRASGPAPPAPPRPPPRPRIARRTRRRRGSGTARAAGGAARRFASGRRDHSSSAPSDERGEDLPAEPARADAVPAVAGAGVDPRAGHVKKKGSWSLETSIGPPHARSTLARGEPGQQAAQPRSARATVGTSSKKLASTARRGRSAPSRSPSARGRRRSSGSSAGTSARRRSPRPPSSRSRRAGRAPAP